MNIHDICENHNDETRLNQDNASSIEYLMTMKYIKKYLRKGYKVLELGAGTGVYSITLAKEGYDITALELVKKNLEIMKSKSNGALILHPVEGNALDLSQLEDNSFDLVLCLGPLYHVSGMEDKKTIIKEASRVCKQDGILFFTYLSNDMVVVTETMKEREFIIQHDYNHDTFQVNDMPYCFMTIESMERLMMEFPLEFLHHVALDGFAVLLKDQINAMEDNQFLQWLKFHEYMCEKPHALAYSNHLLYITRKYEL